MRIHSESVSLGVLLSCLLSAHAMAGPNANAKVIVNLPNVDLGACSQAFRQATCSSIRTAGVLYPRTYMAFITVTDADPDAGIAGVQFGVTYDGVEGSGIDVFGWYICATLEFPQPGWPASGTGNLVTWDYVNRCQRGEPGGAGTGVAAVVGAFYLAAYSPDCLRVTPRPVDRAAKVASCMPIIEDIIESDDVHPIPSHLGFACFSENGNVPGYNPCGLNTPVESTTWGAIKALMR